MCLSEFQDGICRSGLIGASIRETTEIDVVRLLCIVLCYGDGPVGAESGVCI